MTRHYKDIKFFNRAEISPRCCEIHTPLGAWTEAARRLETTFQQMLGRLDQQPEGRIVMAIGWLPPEEIAAPAEQPSHPVESQ